MIRGRALRRAPSVVLDGRGGFAEEAWGPLVALSARRIAPEDDGGRFPAGLSERIAARRGRGGPGGTGLAVVLAYDAEPWGGRGRGDLAIEVDAAIRWESDRAFLVAAPGSGTDVECLERELDGSREVPAPVSVEPPSRPAPRTSLPRTRYLAAVDRVRALIRDGEIYQANLSQRFEAAMPGSPVAVWSRLREVSPAPRAAFVEAGGTALLSLSPETFVDLSKDGLARTVPIKGTRRRGGTPAEDEASAADLLSSAKDRAELVMIVDLERNDLGRVAEPGSVRVPTLAALRSYPAVHHLVAEVRATLRHDVDTADWIEAVFPGGSITGAPKRRAMEILAEIEPVPRGWFTGSLFWFDDDGSTRSSILIRSIVARAGIARLGAGGGVVADSDPESEWRESNDKARALTRALGFEPEEAS